MKIYLILFLLASLNIDADELDVLFEALNKNYIFNEIVYENELAIQKSNGEIIKKTNQFEVHINSLLKNLIMFQRLKLIILIMILIKNKQFL